MTHRRRRLLPSSAAPAPPPAVENDDVLSEILLRLPPRPSSLPRASLVCARWRRLVSDPHFLRRFRAHHRKPPLLGFFSRDADGDVVFTSTLDSPDRISAARFSLRLKGAINCHLLGCRHGRVLVVNRRSLYCLVWDPVSGDQLRVAFPPAFRGKDGKYVANGAVVCAAGEHGHVHGGCHSSPFQVVLLGVDFEGVFACVYSSGTGAWGSVISLSWPYDTWGVAPDCPNVMVGNSIWWLLLGERSFGVLEFDLSRQSLATVEIPSNIVDSNVWMGDSSQFLITPADGGGLNFLVLKGFNARVWKWEANCYGDASWVLGNDFDLNSLLLLKAGVDAKPPLILGLNEDDNVMFLSTNAGVFMVHLESLKFKKFYKRIIHSDDTHHPFTSFYSSEARAKWSVKYKQGLVELLLDHNIPRFQKNNGWSSEGWTSIKREFNRKFPECNFSKAQIQEHESQLKKEYMLLMAACKSSGAALDTNLEMDNAKVAKSRKKSFLLFESLGLLYEGHIAEGVHRLSTEHIGLSNEGDDCENLVSHIFESEVPASIKGVQGAYIKRSRSERLSENGTSSSSSIPPTPGAKKIKKIVVETIEAYMEFKRNQHKPQEEFSVAKCINTMHEMVDVSDDEKVLSCDLFRDAVNREIFLSLDVTLRTMWLKKQLTKFQ